MRNTEQQAQTQYQHAEAFCLMMYKCRSCGHAETVWNSRDGVTPFIIGCQKCGCEAQHVNWQGDQCVPLFKPSPGMRVFVDMPEEVKIPLAKRRVDRFKGTKYEVTGEEREAAIKDIAAGFEPGTPYLITWDPAVRGG